MKQFGTGLRISAASFAAVVAVCCGAITPSAADESAPPVETADTGRVVSPVPVPGADPPEVVAPAPDLVPVPAPADPAASDPEESTQAPAEVAPAAPQTDYRQPAPAIPYYRAPVEQATFVPGTEAPGAGPGGEPAVNEEPAEPAAPATDPAPALTPAAAVPSPSGTQPPAAGIPTQAAAVAPTGSPLIVQLLTVGLLLAVGFFYFRFIGSHGPRTPAKSAK